MLRLTHHTAALPLLAAATCTASINIQFDYSLDENNFFAENPQAKATLEAAGDFYERHLSDAFTAIQPGSGNSWSTTFDHPGREGDITLHNQSIPENTILVYAGARDLSPNGLGYASYPKEVTGSGDPDFMNSLNRGQVPWGQPDAEQTDVGMWGGAITFSTEVDWHFDYTTPTPEEMFDFYGLALHELAHVLGVGIAPSWNNLVQDLAGLFDYFAGEHVAEAYNGYLRILRGHIDRYARYSNVFLTDIEQFPAMGGATGKGERLLMTEVDMAMFADTGWEVVVPEPGHYALGFGLAMTGLVTFIRRRK